MTSACTAYSASQSKPVHPQNGYPQSTIKSLFMVKRPAMSKKKESFPEREERIIELWEEESVFAESVKQREGASRFSFFDGPPFATGLPHYGHLIGSLLKDVIPRYKTMKGYYVPRRFGWDTHGLPVESEIEKAFELSGAPSIEAFGIARFNEECRSIVQRYTSQWETTIRRIGRWVDFSQTWKTMDLSYMESVWWVFGQLWEKGLVYEGFKVMPISAKLGTPLSNFEATENYKEVDDPSIVVALPLLEDPDTSLLVWTTTPWTLISNLAATVHAKIEYAKIEVDGKRYILAKEAIPRHFEEYILLDTFLGETLKEKRYEPLFPHFANRDAFRVIVDEFVTLEDGTGIVHTAPAFGETDFYAAKKAGIDLVCPVDNNGRFTEEVPEYAGRFVKDADKEIIARLKEMGRLVKRGTIRHRYPFCWRTDTPLIYKAITTWFVDVESLKDRLIEANQQVHWVPGHIKEGRFGNWIEGARDWAISRNRYWGTPIPIWRAQDGSIQVVSSIQELETLTGQSVVDLHRHKIDHLSFTIDGKTYTRVPEVFDCWFESGSMPYARNHYPFENKEETLEAFPADFIAEGVDQTRGWFYTLMVLSTALFESPAYKNVIANGIVLAEDGNKMSKRLKNYPEPLDVIHKYGADAVRLYLLNSPVVKADDLRFTERGVELALRQQLIPLFNAYSFFATYDELYSWHAQNETPAAEIDRWILSMLHRLIHQVEEGLDEYDLTKAVAPFVDFIDQLTNWYIRRCRRRFWEEEETSDRNDAFTTLHHVLLELCKVAAPFIPFLSEAIYQELSSEEMPVSVHLCDFPTYSEKVRDHALERGMDAVQLAVSLGHSLRKEHKIKTRQPLGLAHIVCSDPKLLLFLQSQEHLIAEELNVKAVQFHHHAEEFVRYTIKPNFRVLGKKAGKKTKQVASGIEALDQDAIHALSNGETITLLVEEEKIEIAKEDVQISRAAKQGQIAQSLGQITIALDTELTEELLLEGIARELVNKINSMRRDADFAVTDRIKVHIATSPRIAHAFDQHAEFIKGEVLATEVHFDFLPETSVQWEINGEPAAIAVEKFVI